MNDKAAGQWAIAGRRSLLRSALVEAAEQLARALQLMATLPATPALRRNQIKLQIELAQALMHTKGHAAAETQAAFDAARSMIERASALGEPPDDPLILFAVLYGFWVAQRMTFKGEVARGLADQFLTLARKQGQTVPLMIGNLIMGISLLLTGDFAGGKAHLDRAGELYEPATHRPLAARFGHDVRVTVLSWRPYALWALGSPMAALDGCARAVADARDTGHAASLMFALAHTSLTLIRCGRYELSLIHI